MSREESSALDRIESILEFWFAATPPAGPLPAERQELWFGGAEATDRLIRGRFAEDVQRAQSGEYDQWRQSPHGALALILLLDQFTRNMFRHSPAAYASDEKALRLCRAGLAQGQDQNLSILQRAFFYLPLEHAEEPQAQALSVALFAELLAQAPVGLKAACRGFLDYAERHREIIERFGRFPHRNQTLGRPSTAEEEEFLRQPGSSF